MSTSSTIPFPQPFAPANGHRGFQDPLSHRIFKLRPEKIFSHNNCTHTHTHTHAVQVKESDFPPTAPTTAAKESWVVHNGGEVSVRYYYQKGKPQFGITITPLQINHPKHESLIIEHRSQAATAAFPCRERPRHGHNEHLVLDVEWRWTRDPYIIHLDIAL